MGNATHFMNRVDTIFFPFPQLPKSSSSQIWMDLACSKVFCGSPAYWHKIQNLCITQSSPSLSSASSSRTLQSYIEPCWTDLRSQNKSCPALEGWDCVPSCLCEKLLPSSSAEHISVPPLSLGPALTFSVKPPSALPTPQGSICLLALKQ